MKEMEKGSLLLKKEIYMMDNGKMIKDMGRVLKFMIIEINILVNGN